MSSVIMHAPSSSKHPLAHILGSCAFTSVIAPFSVCPNSIMERHPTPLGVYPPPTQSAEGGGSKEMKNQVKMATGNQWRSSIIYICPWALHSFQSLPHCRAASTVIPLLSKATSTPSIQPNLGLLRIRPPLTSANTLLAKRHLSILPTSPNRLNTLVHSIR